MDIIKLNNLLTTVKDDAHKVQWNNQAATAFSDSEQALHSDTLLFHPKQDAPTRDASDYTVVQQYMDQQCYPIAHCTVGNVPALLLGVGHLLLVYCLL